jgi:hypothetical protein
MTLKPLMGDTFEVLHFDRCDEDGSTQSSSADEC